MKNSIGAVVIGRNEGERLRKCLESVIYSSNIVVYVDSGSTDNSIELAEKLGVDVVNLDVSIPFTAARARNEGFNRLHKLAPDLSFVQFIDGDCEMDASWLDLASKYITKNPGVAIVCGRRRERYPDVSAYNMLCDIEWDTPVGEAKACGGDALMKISAFLQVEGFNPNLIAGEEPELCVRIRQQGWKICRLDLEMTLHDANMTRFGQWWKRNVRSGYAFALGEYLHGAKPEQHWVKEARRGRIWGGYIPFAIVLAILINPLYSLVAIIYPLQALRIGIKSRHKVSEYWKYAFFIILGKFPEMQGQFRFYFNQLFNSDSKIIEYK